MRKDYTYKIWRTDWNETEDDAVEFKSVWHPNNTTYVAAEYAENYFNEGDGPDDNWPIQLHIKFETDSKSFIEIHKVDYESEPSFYSNMVNRLEVCK